jgi:hypothetical protein
VPDDQARAHVRAARRQRARCRCAACARLSAASAPHAAACARAPHQGTTRRAAQLRGYNEEART